jgi:pyridoxine 5-phosphate synthase
MPRLNVNIDHVATLRQARRGTDPDPVLAAYLAEIAGADGIVVHLREDRRHIQIRDLHILRQTVKTKLNLEMAPTSEMVGIALDVKPDMVTLVPEKREEITTEGGLNVIDNHQVVSNVVRRLKEGGLFVSLFIDPDQEQIKASKNSSADMVELHTGLYAEAKNDRIRREEFKKVEYSVKIALDHDLRISAGHGLDYKNVRMIASVSDIEELNIGFSIIARSIIVGMEKAVREMIEICG